MRRMRGIGHAQMAEFYDQAVSDGEWGTGMDQTNRVFGGRAHRLGVLGRPVSDSRLSSGFRLPAFAQPGKFYLY